MLDSYEKRKQLEELMKTEDRSRTLREIAAEIGASKEELYHEFKKTVGLGRDWSRYNATKAQNAYDRRIALGRNMKASGTIKPGTIKPTFYEQTPVPGFVGRTKRKFTIEHVHKNTGLNETPEMSIWSKIRQTIFNKKIGR